MDDSVIIITRYKYRNVQLDVIVSNRNSDWKQTLENDESSPEIRAQHRFEISRAGARDRSFDIRMPNIDIDGVVYIPTSREGRRVVASRSARGTRSSALATIVASIRRVTPQTSHKRDRGRLTMVNYHVARARVRMRAAVRGSSRRYRPRSRFYNARIPPRTPRILL